MRSFVTSLRVPGHLDSNLRVIPCNDYVFARSRGLHQGTCSIALYWTFSAEATDSLVVVAGADHACCLRSEKIIAEDGGVRRGNRLRKNLSGDYLWRRSVLLS